MADIKVTVDNIQVTVPEGSTLLEAAHAAGIDIPTLCFLKDVNEIGACRMCLCEVEGARGLVTSCVFPVQDGMVAHTNTARLREARRKTLQLILSDHNMDCLACVRSGNCELQKLCKRYGVEDSDYYAGKKNDFTIDDSSASIVRDNSKCILCRRCVGACENLQGIGVIGTNNRGFDTFIGCAFDMPLAETSCVNCGQCIVACPVGALHEKDSTKEVMAAIEDPTKHVVVQAAPSTRVGLGDCFGMPLGAEVEGKMAAAMRRLGFDAVFDTNFSADLTIVEEANELIERVTKGGVLPMITSCSPGWIKFCEHYYPDQLAHVSSCKSPQQMFGAVAKSYYAELKGIDPKDIVSVSIMPCTAKKFELGRPDQDATGYPDVDYALTTRELGRMITEAGIDFVNLPPEKYDSPLGEYTGAAVIFGATGGVMEAALRTAVEWITGETLQKLDFVDVRGTKGIKEASYDLNGLTVKVAVASGLANARKVMDMVRAGTADYTFIEIMACPGGCVNGGGQPHVDSSVRNFADVRAIRAKSLYDLDASLPLRKSHENPEIIALYENYLGEYGSHKAHHLLHTTYVERVVNQQAD
ncbi:MAG: iron hydrogenase small subunit [Mogibacterium sp.]|nr:iron hydrogenase small subunit [Mogibacterium sp.]